MATHIPGNNNQQQTAMAQAMQQAAQAAAGNTAGAGAAPAAAPAASNIWDFGDDLVDSPLVNAIGSEALNRFNTVLGTMEKRGAEIKLTGIDNSVETGWRYSTVVLSMLDPRNGVVAYYPMMVEETMNGELTGTSVRLGNSDRTVTVQPVPTDGMDASYVARISEQVQEQWSGSTASKFLYVPGLLLPKGLFKLDNDEEIAKVLKRAADSCRSLLAEMQPGFADVNLANHRGNTQVRVRSTADRADLKDTVGLPVIQDVEIVLAGQSEAAAAAQVNQLQAALTVNNAAGAVEQRFGRASVYFDARMLPARQGFMAMGGGVDPRELTRRFVNEIVLSSVELNKISTSASLMLMVSMVAAIVEPRVFKGLQYSQLQQAVQLYGGNQGFIPTNLGMLNLYAGYATPPGTANMPYDLLSNTSSPREFLEFTDNVFTEGIAVSIDIQRMGAQASYTSILAACARDEAWALAFFKDSLQKLTGNKFATKFFGPGNEGAALTSEHIFAERNNTIFTGYYPAKVGNETRDLDLRHINLVAVINRFGQSDPDMVTKWVQSFLVANIDPTLRMANRREVIEAYTNGSAVFTGMAERNTFNPVLLATITACNVDNKFKPALVYQDPLANADTGLTAPAFYQHNGMFTAAAAATLGSQFQQGGGGNTPGLGGAYINQTPGRY